MQLYKTSKVLVLYILVCSFLEVGGAVLEDLFINCGHMNLAHTLVFEMFVLLSLLTSRPIFFWQIVGEFIPIVFAL